MNSFLNACVLVFEIECFVRLKQISNERMSMYGKRHCPDPTKQDGTQSAESLIAQEAIASLIKKVEDLTKKGQFFNKYQVPMKTVYLDEMRAAELVAISKVFASQLDSQQKQIKKLFATNLSTKMRAFCIRDVIQSPNQNRNWWPGRTISVITY